MRRDHIFPFEEQNATRARDRRAEAPRHGTTVSSVAHHDPRAMLVVMNRRLASEPSRSPRRLVSAMRPGARALATSPRTRARSAVRLPIRRRARRAAVPARSRETRRNVSVSSGEVSRVRRARRRFDPRLARTTRVQQRAHGASAFAAGVAVLVTVFRRAPSPIRSRAGRRGASLKRPRRVHGGAHVPSPARLASRLGDCFRHSDVAAAADARASPDAATVARETRRPRTSVHVDAVVERARSCSNSAGSMFSASFRERWFREGSGRRRGERWILRRRASRRGPREGLLVRRGRARFRGGAAAASAARRASSRAETGVPPPRHPGLPRAADDDLVVVVAAATVLCRFRSSRRAVGKRVLGSVLEEEVEGDGSSAEISRADASTDVHHRSSLADASSARDGCSGVGGVSGTAAVSFARLSDADRASLARPRARARLRELLRARHLARRVHDPTEDSIDERADLVGVAHGCVTVVD